MLRKPMTEPLFDIIFRGDIVPGHSIQDVKTRLGQLFKADAAKVEALFSGGAVPLKRNVDKATAEKYKTVLTKAGAGVQIRPAGGAAKTQTAAQPARPPAIGGNDHGQIPSTATGGSNHGQISTTPANSGFTLAPAGSNLLNPSETRQVPHLDLDLSRISIKPMAGDLLEESEKPKRVAADIAVGDYKVAAPGADLLEGYHREQLPLPELDPDFDIAEVGADLLDPADRPQKEAVEVDTSHLGVLPLFSDK